MSVIEEVSLRSIFVCIFRVARYYPPRDALSLSVGRTRVLQPGKLQIIRSNRATVCLLPSVSAVPVHLPSAHTPFQPATKPSYRRPPATLAVSIHFSSDITTRLTGLPTVARVPFQWHILAYRDGVERKRRQPFRGASSTACPPRFCKHSTG